MTKTLLLFSIFFLGGCAIVTVVDGAATAVVYGVKTTIKVVDLITPDIINKDK